MQIIARAETQFIPWNGQQRAVVERERRRFINIHFTQGSLYAQRLAREVVTNLPDIHFGPRSRYVLQCCTFQPHLDAPLNIDINSSDE